MDIELRFLGHRHKFNTRDQFIYCVLPYIEGQRYTFDHSYEGCGDGEEFLLLLRVRWFGKEKVSSARFQISCRHGNHWIKRVSDAKNYAIFLNEKDVCDTPDGMKISSGDIFVLAENVFQEYYPPPRWWKPKWKVFSKGIVQRKNCPEDFQYTFVFCFQPRSIPTTLDPNASQKIEYYPPDTSESYLALENTLILSKIFSYLALPTLKNCRLVSSFWESEAVPWLKSRSEIRFQFHVYRGPVKSMKFFLYRNEMLPFAHPNWHVDRLNTGDTATFSKLGDDLDRLLTNCDPMIRRLSCVYCHTINTALLARLLNRVAGSLEELCVLFDNCENAGEDITEFFELIEFPLLKKFEIDMGDSVLPSIRHEWYVNLTPSLIKLSSKVSSLYFKSNSAPLNGYCLREIVSNRDYPRLREVRIKKIDRDGMEVLRGLRAGLVRLEINGFSDECEIRQVEDNLQEVVQRQRNSLEFLYLEVPPDWAVVPVGDMPFLNRKDIFFGQVEC
ncbi:uncharacterized protein LOC118436834 [Folsomia candida]|uniref:F-box domain-containing protein n=1 Tax=Folsomia candida TaxID=158441 RepID=A0A226DVP8_FOLCA|nr:uncharacterized protein LOC118436834 [Folsomia candida]OXA49532.1 hypothetical protein Fcan01_15451 [Folsomia candida]